MVEEKENNKIENKIMMERNLERGEAWESMEDSCHSKVYQKRMNRENRVREKLVVGLSLS